MSRRSRGDAIDGVLLLDKPSGITSNLALQKARRLLNARKAGHGGTLDPLATGLLPLLFGEATKFSSDLLDADKVYEAAIQLGVRTNTADAEGDVIETCAVNVDRAALDAVLSRFVGSIQQIPPMYSALKRDGKALYEYARQGVEVKRAPRTVQIARIELLSFDVEQSTFAIRVACSKGTYVRTLADDIGQLLGCGAHLAALRRTQVGELSLNQAASLEQLEQIALGEREATLLPPDALLQKLDRVDLGERYASQFLHGGQIDLGGSPGRKRVYGPHNQLLGVADLDEQGVLNPRRLLSSEEINK